MGMKFTNPVLRALKGFFTAGRSVGAGFPDNQKAACLTGLLLGTAPAVSAIQVTYQVNLGTQIALGNFHPGVDTVFVSGDFFVARLGIQRDRTGQPAIVLTSGAGNTNLYTGTFNIVNAAGDHREP